MTKYKIENIEDYLQLIHPILMKGYLWTCLIMMNIIGMPTIFVGSASVIIKVMLIPIIILNIWIIILLLNVEKWQCLYILFIGVYSTIMSILLIMTAYRFYMLNSKANEILFLSITIGGYILILLFGLRFHSKALKKGYYSFEYQRKFSKYGALMAITPGLSLIIGKTFLVGVNDQDLIVLVISSILLFLAYIFELGINNIHKYYLVVQYKEHVKMYSLPKRKRKNRK
jgi:hypothetical protein